MSEHAVLTAPTVDLPDIVKRYSEGEPIASICSDYGVTVYTIYNWMFTGLGDQAYEHTITKALVRGIADADVAVEESTDMLSFQKAHARAKLKRMDLERRRPKLYGPKQEVSTDSKITVIVQRERPQPVTINTQAIDIVDGSAPNHGV